MDRPAWPSPMGGSIIRSRRRPLRPCRRIKHRGDCAGGTISRRSAVLEFGSYRAELGHFMDTFLSRAIGFRYGACYTAAPGQNWFIFETGISRGTSLDQLLTIAARAAQWMRTPPFDKVFPPDYVQTWEEAYPRRLYRDWLLTNRPKWFGWFHRFGKIGVRLKIHAADYWAKRAVRKWRKQTEQK